VIHLEEVSVRYPGARGPAAHALFELDLEVRPGETLCLIGPSGCGKTTTLRLVNRLVQPSAGCVRVGGRDVASLDPVRLRRGIGYVIQAGGLFPHRSVRQNVALLCRLEGWTERDARRRTDELLALVRLAPEEYGERYPAQLSGGERQRVGVARALALDPPVLLMDEPFGALDPLTRRELQREFAELRGKSERTIVLVTHDLDEAFLLGDRIGVLEGGRLAGLGTREELRREPGSAFVERFLEEHRP